MSTTSEFTLIDKNLKGITAQAQKIQERPVIFAHLAPCPARLGGPLLAVEHTVVGCQDLVGLPGACMETEMLPDSSPLMLCPACRRTRCFPCWLMATMMLIKRKQLIFPFLRAILQFNHTYRIALQGEWQP